MIKTLLIAALSLVQVSDRQPTMPGDFTPLDITAITVSVGVMIICFINENFGNLGQFVTVVAAVISVGVQVYAKLVQVRLAKLKHKRGDDAE